MKFPKMVKHLLAGDKITRDRWIRKNMGYLVLKDDKILSVGTNEQIEGDFDDLSIFGVGDMKKKGWRIYNESD